MTFTQAFPSTPDYSWLTFPTTLLLFSLPCPHPSFMWTKTMSYVLPPTPPPLVYFERTLFHQLVVDFPFEHLNIFQGEYFVAKAVWRCNLVKVLGQQPRYQRVPSSVTMWQLFHRGPSVFSWHHKLLTKQLLPTYTQSRRWGRRPQNQRSIAREDSNNKGSFHNKGQGVQIRRHI